MPERNALFYGDNLDILRRHVASESVDLVYLDPPFNSQRAYNVLFKEKSGEASPAQIEAFTDTWEWDRAAERTYNDLVDNAPHNVAQMIAALRQFIGANDVMAYLVMMAVRLVELHRVLKPTGSLYLHCDPTASHYLKVILDTIFGKERFRNEITWKRTSSHSDAKKWSPIADVILYYAKGDTPTWNAPFGAYDEAYLADKYRYFEPDGRRYRLDNMRSPNPRPNLTYEWNGHQPHPNGWAYSRETTARLDAEGRIWYPDSKDKRPQLKRYLDERSGQPISNIWTDIDPINSQGKERLGYPTQKPLSLLQRIIAASYNPGDLVLDPFCGCGTAIVAAEKLGRRLIGIDITHLAISLMRYRLADSFSDVQFAVRGEPADEGSARMLAETDRYQFQWWALSLIRAKPIEGKEKKGADRGIDGVITFQDDSSGKLKRCLVQVKSGHVSSATMATSPVR